MGALLLAVGCGGAARLEAVEPGPEGQQIAQLAAGSSVAVQRPTPGVALLSLWIAAGARDASVPQLALAAGYWAGKKHNLTPRVLAEGTEFSLLCDTTREALGACAARLGAVLEPAAPSDKDAAALRERVRNQRALAQGDDARRAEQLALTALLGDEARGLLPLGVESDDARIDAASVRGFIERNYAAGRALLLGLGAVQKGELDKAAQRMKQRPGATRSARSLSGATGGVRVEAGESGQIALTMTTTSVEHAASLSERFRAIHGDARASISSLRGATLVHWQLPAGELPFARLQSTVFDARRLLIEASDDPPAPAPDTLEALSRSIGESWVVRGANAGALAEGLVGVALIWPRDDRAVDANSEAALDKVRERARSAVEAGTRNSAVRVRGASDGRLRAKLDNGAALEIVRRPGERWFSAALRWDAGSATDAATGHGRAALLATLMADGCGLASGRALDLRLSAMHARLWPLLDARGIGVGVSAPAEHTEEALDLMLRCALRPSFSARSVEDARARLMRALWQDERRQLEALLGQLLAPAAPGSVAAWGTPQGVAKVDAAELRRLHAQRARGPGLTLFVTADRDPDQLGSFAARRLSHLNASAAERASVETGPSSDMAAALVDDQRLRVLIGMSVARDEKALFGAEAFAVSFARALSAKLGSADFFHAATGTERAFAGLALSLREEQLEGLNALTASVLAELRDKPDAHFRAALDQLRTSQSAALSSARGWVEASFAGRARAEYALEPELALIRKLAKAQPSFMVLRPRP